MFALRRYIFAFNVLDNDYFDGLNEICENVLHFALLFHPNNYCCLIFLFTDLIVLAKTNTNYSFYWDSIIATCFFNAANLTYFLALIEIREK